MKKSKDDSQKSEKMKKVKVSEQEKVKFPYSQFPVKVIHKDGKNLEETKTCYFQSEEYAKKYISGSRMKKGDYEMYMKEVK